MIAAVLNNYPMFKQETPCPLIEEPISLYQNTWHHHIRVEHPEIIAPEDLQNAIKTASYVARSKPGPGGRYANNLVIVAVHITLRSSKLHVFVESPASAPRVSSAMYSRKYHGEVLWSSPDHSLRASYDKDVDVLYLSKERPVPSTTEEGDDGLLFRFSLADEQPSGVTVLSYRELWSEHRSELTEKVSSFLKVPPEVTQRALDSVDA